MGIARTPCVAEDILKVRFHRLGSELHPDVKGGDSHAFEELNSAWQTLREPVGCLRHFLELQHPDSLAAATQTPAELAGMFMAIAEFTRAAQKFCPRYASASSPLSKALLESERCTLRSKREALAHSVDARIHECMNALREDAAEPSNVATILASLVFLSKWSAQLGEFRLSL